MQYELFYLIGANKEGELETIKKEVAEIVAQEGGEFSEKQTEEKRKLSYEVKHQTHGIYIAQRFELEDPTKIQEINRKLNLYVNVLRFLISKASELPELLSKEERKAKSASTEIKQKSFEKKEIKEIKKEVKAEPARNASQSDAGGEKIAEITAEKKAEADDIDKKLEELLNI